MTKNKTILVTGAAGYIGSHTCVELLLSGFDVVGIDNFSNSTREAITRVEKIADRTMSFYEADVRDPAALDALLREHAIDAVIHFAGLKAVGESVVKPLLYFDNNVSGTVTLLHALAKAKIKNFVFSSSATVYGDPQSVPIHESAALSATNPYGRSKLIVEQILGDMTVSDPSWAFGILRYFNPVGAHPSGLIGEDPNGIPNNLMPFIAQVAVGRRERLAVFGNDYPTPDGTGVRDYIHVVDLAQGHVAALNKLFTAGKSFTVNLGTGLGYSVLEMVRAFEAASSRSVPHDITSRRPGDIAECYADPSEAKKVLNWEAQKNLADMCTDHWRWQRMNPSGFKNNL
ncbi:UDP-glucose 4-epimerase GalE [Glaciimonas immobilis]|uniref:UDP-glucose 4-epimerase n=1 Tax=Glaciimonas immobilis TaxID=728004 RepID=A0A840RXH1_9BURK|nr:UDP-glucose 4-epimerase GalE [Glaciimonas immobilis]KAF3996073.1 UDP-glucose 4-epimerase GalE [Glaciimonas immobilis]MBB5201788.1 UDP-glucose 4-epimerase [Glaciimonas immobilis]